VVVVEVNIFSDSSKHRLAASVVIEAQNLTMSCDFIPVEGYKEEVH